MANQHPQYSDAATSLIIKLRKEGLVGQRLYDRFHRVIPNRSYQAVLSKVERLREQKEIG